MLCENRGGESHYFFCYHVAGLGVDGDVWRPAQLFEHVLNEKKNKERKALRQRNEIFSSSYRQEI